MNIRLCTDVKFFDQSNYYSDKWWNCKFEYRNIGARQEFKLDLELIGSSLGID